jgi:hypothetical protein
MVKVGCCKQFEFIDPFWTDFYFSYLDFTNEQAKIAGLPNEGAAVLVPNENTAVYAALAAGNVTNTGLAYQEYIQTNLPTLRMTQTNAHTLSLTWTPVAVHYLLEEANNLVNSNWVSLVIPPRSAGADYTTSIELTNRAGFLRLHLP